jgi:DNA-binding beta-propeller fold protein YncE
MTTGELTGITCDPDANLYVASQNQGAGRIYKLDKTTLAILDTIDMPGTTSLEGLQFAAGNSIFVGVLTQGVHKVQSTSPMVSLGMFTDPGLYFPVPVTIDNAGNVYTADYENGSGTLPADLFVFNSNGKVIASRIASDVYGPFGMVVAGTYLPCGAYQPIR